MDDTSGWAVGIFIFAFIFFVWGYFDLQREVKDYRNALREANSTIEEMNEFASVSDDLVQAARDSTWSGYDDMQYAVDNLRTIGTMDTVKDPYPKNQ